jgi:hypothetical protein
MIQVLRVNLRYRKAMLSKMPREFQESDILFAHVIQDADRTGFSAGQPDNFSPGTTQLPLQRLHVLYWLVEVLLKEIVENVHGVRRESRGRRFTTKISSKGDRIAVWTTRT